MSGGIRTHLSCQSLVALYFVTCDIHYRKLVSTVFKLLRESIIDRNTALVIRTHYICIYLCVHLERQPNQAGMLMLCSTLSTFSSFLHAFFLYSLLILVLRLVTTGAH